MKSITLNILLLSLSLHCYSQSAKEQEAESDTDKKNSVHTTGTIRFDIGVSATASYERVLFKDALSKHQLFIKGELGGVVTYNSDNGFIFGPQVGYLFGSRKVHFETSVGFYMLNRSSHDQSYGSPAISFRPTGLIGYRSHKPGGWFIFRTGFSYPLGVYFGFGVAL